MTKPIALPGDPVEIHRLYGYSKTADWIKTIASKHCPPDVAYMVRMNGSEVTSAVKVTGLAGGQNETAPADSSP